MNTHQFSAVQRFQQKSNGPPGQLTDFSHPWWHSPFAGYAFSLVIVAGAFLINWVETSVGVDIHDYFIGMLFVIGTFLVCWIWGTGPALLALIVGILCTDYLAIPPIHTFSFYLWPGLASLLPFIVIQLLILWLIARQKHYQQHLFFANQVISHYAEELTERNQACMESNVRLEQADQVKDQFLSMASHELRTPVTSIYGYVQLLLRRLKKQNTQNPERLVIYDSLGKIDEQARRLIGLVNDLLDINSLRSGKIPLRLASCDLCFLCRKVIEEQHALTGRLIDSLFPDGPVIIQADKERLSQVIINLVSNALKYSPDDTMIIVEISQEPERAIIAVHNDGSVLSKEQQETIFEPFYRCPDAQSSVKPGWGLGLAISKEIVERHHGRIWVESSEGNGTTFFVDLPSSPCQSG